MHARRAKAADAIARFWLIEQLVHSAISARVRPQPEHVSFSSSRHRPMHGDGTGIGVSRRNRS
jgi:hypothetical protein